MSIASGRTVTTRNNEQDFIPVIIFLSTSQLFFTAVKIF